MPSMMRLDRETGTGTMATVKAFLRRNQDDMGEPCESIVYGPSTSNQVSLSYCLCIFLCIDEKKCECHWSCHVKHVKQWEHSLGRFIRRGKYVAFVVLFLSLNEPNVDQF